jgi:hypothetical protein
MAKVFISYANQDTEFAEALKSALNELGHTSWWFDEGVAPGQKWQEVIIGQLRNVDALVILVSPASLHSKWVSHELEAALAYSEEKGKPIIIPVMLEDVTLEPPLSRYLGIRAPQGSAEEVAIKIAMALERQIGRVKAQEEERKEVQKKVEVSAADFIQKSLLDLREREVSYRRLAYFWYSVAYITLVASVGFGVWRALVQAPTTKDWPSIVELAISGVIVIGLLVALAKYAFTLGKSFMVEALRNADRRHAISFGEFFLRAYGADAEWKDVKEAFQNWNIDKGSYFIGQSQSDFDPQIFSLAIEIAKSISGKPADVNKKSKV